MYENAAKHKVTVNYGEAAKIVVELVQASVWYQCTPMPDDQFEIEVKAEAKTVLEQSKSNNRK